VQYYCLSQISRAACQTGTAFNLVHCNYYFHLVIQNLSVILLTCAVGMWLLNIVTLQHHSAMSSHLIAVFQIMFLVCRNWKVHQLRKSLPMLLLCLFSQQEKTNVHHSTWLLFRGYNLASRRIFI